jgi:hypothetical protein
VDGEADTLRGDATPDAGEVTPHHELLCGYTNDERFVSSARRLVARQYLHEGYVTAADIDRHGILRESVDPYHPSSAYFVAFDPVLDEVVATIRQIGFDSAAGMKSFPMMSYLDLWETARAPLDQSSPETWVELSGLAKEHWVRTEIVHRLYREMWARSFAQGHEFWLIAADSRLARRLKGVFLDSIVIAGAPVDYLGSPTVPLYMRIVHGVDAICDRYFITRSPSARDRCRDTARYFLAGIDASYFSPDQLQRFAAMDIDFTLDLRDGSLPQVNQPETVQ